MILITVFIALICGRICSSIFCNDGSNPCQLDQGKSVNSYFLPENGYHCFDGFDGQISCTCPDNSTTRDRPCRLCDRDPNPCGNGPSTVTCTDINQSFSCLCNDGHEGFVLSAKPCENQTVLSSSKDKCDNEGVRDPTTNQCHCPSGFIGDKCDIRSDAQLCEKIECMSKGVCAIRSILNEEKIYQSKCLCSSLYQGEYCEQKSVLGSCNSKSCLNEGICQEYSLGYSKYLFCECKPGWYGIRCEKQYFRCSSSGYFLDQLMKKQGKYFWCISLNNGYFLKQLSCPKGLQFHLEKKLCLG